jgi:hypothetical protein
MSDRSSAGFLTSKELRGRAFVIFSAGPLQTNHSSHQLQHPLAANVDIFFGDNDKLDHRARLTAYAGAMDKVARSYPDDREASLFNALSLLATADPLDATYGVIAESPRAGGWPPIGARVA